MSKNLLAVDDSATMRKVLEITFSGEDFQVSAAPDRAGAMAKLGENPSVVVIDTSLAGDDGYAIAKEVRAKLPRAVVLLLASRYNPYDAAKGKDAGADDYMDKPFDTQQMIDKVRKLLSAKEAGGPAVAAAPPPAPVAPPPMAARPVASPPAPPVAPKPYAPGPPAARSGTLMFSVDGPPMPAITGPAHTAQTAAPPPAVVATATPTPPPPAPQAQAATAAPVNGHMAPKLAALGLSPAQVEAVLALSREVVEQVVWEVVPQLAEAMIKEEIARLTKEA